MKYDVIVIGAGTSGMMAAVSAAEHGAKTLLLEKNKRLGKKLLLTGGGRCNVTNNRSKEEVIAHIPGNGKFLFSAFSQFDNHQIMAFFEEHGVHLKEEDHGRMFPVSNRSKSVVNCLSEQLEQLHVTIKTEASVKNILAENNQITGVELNSGETYQTACLIVATGGKTYQHTGSTGDGYRFAKKLGHTVTPLFATEAPLVSNEPFIRNKQLQGLSMQDVSLSILGPKEKPIVTHQMDLLFTHFGLSGPAALRCSMFVNKLLESASEVTAILDVFPEKDAPTLTRELELVKKEGANKSVKNALKFLLPERYLLFLLEKATIDENKPYKQLEPKELEKFVTLLKNFPIKINGTWPIEKSFVTGGGISLKEITPKTLESKIVAGLFFTGEVLDINGYTGGYNITAAFVTGYVAGKHAAQIAAYTNYD